MLIPFRAMVRKDLQLFITDRRAVIMTILAPILIGSFFGYVFDNRSGRKAVSRINAIVVDQDNSATSREITAQLQADKALAVNTTSLDDARTAVRTGKAAAAVVIPKDFGSNAGQAFFSTAKKPEIGVLYDPSHSAELQMIKGILTGQVMQAVSKEMFTGQSGRDNVKDSLANIEKGNLPAEDKKALRELLQSVDKWNAQSEKKQSGAGISQGGLKVPYETREEAITSGKGTEYNGYAHSFAGMSVQFILFMGIDVGIGVLLARQRGLWKRLRTAPISRSLLLGSRAVSAALISMLILVIVFGFAWAIFNVRVEGSFAGFVCVCAAFSLMTASFGLMIAALGKTPEATRGLAVLATLLMVMLGGAWVPTFIFPQWLQKLTLVMPTRWAVDGLDAMTWRGLGFAEAIPSIAMLLLFSAAFGLLAVTRFRWEIDG